MYFLIFRCEIVLVLLIGIFTDHTRLGAWILDGDTTLSYLLKFALSEETYADTTIMFVVSMTTPWNILDQLQTWAAILQDHIDKLKISSHDLEEYRNKCECVIC